MTVPYTLIEQLPEDERFAVELRPYDGEPILITPKGTYRINNGTLERVLLQPEGRK